MLSPNEVVKLVAQYIHEGHRCYVDPSSREIIKFEKDQQLTPEEKDQIVKLENSTKYIKVSALPTPQLIFIMKDFIDDVRYDDISKELKNALNRKNPTRNFLQVVDSNIHIQQHWKNYFAEKNEEYVAEVFIKAYNY